MTHSNATSPSQVSTNRAAIAQDLTKVTEGLIKVWQDLDELGPGRGSVALGSPEMARERYFLPLAKAFIGALKGSSKHAAFYFDERMRYVDKEGQIEDLYKKLEKDFETEVQGIADLLKGEHPQSSVETELRDFHKAFFNPPSPVSKVLFIGDCLFVETRAFLVQRMTSLGQPVDVRSIFFSTRQPMASVDSAIVSEVKRYQPDLIGISLFTYEGVPPYAHALKDTGRPLGGRAKTSVVDGLVRLVHDSINDIRTVSDATVAVHIPCGAPLDRVRRKLPILPPLSRGQRHLLSDLASGLRELVASSENVLAIDESAIVDDLGGLRTATHGAFAKDDVPDGYAHTTALGPALADSYSGLLVDHSLLRKAKVLLVDFDNTLWQGVMAEGEVIHETDRQELLLELKNAGILLVALSKNDESSIRWDEMRLHESDFALKKINWIPKPDNVAAAIKELDVAANTFILLDDNPVERAMVTEMIPSVRALDPTVPETWRSLRRWLDFPSTRQTEEAKRRTDMYREAVERRAALAEPHDYESMMKSLNLSYKFTSATASDMPRLIELIARTSQFNTTTRRRSIAEIGELLTADDTLTYVASLRDRFGDLGVVAVVIFNKNERLFDSVIMSCRAMGFGLEFAILRDIMEITGTGEFRGLFIPTDRNGPAADFFKQAGFQQEDSTMWVLPTDAEGPMVPSWLTHDASK